MSQDLPANSDTDAIIKTLQADRAPVLITGEAGTGKSTLIRHMRTSGLFPKMAVLAPTGIAAINVSGQTLHSFFRLPPRIITPDALTGQRSNRLWKKVDMIVIDEISMVRPDVLDGIDYILRRARRNERAFGGVKMVFVGDFYQLPPVVRGQDAQILQHMGYDTPFAYSAKVLQNNPPHKITLHEVHRQSQGDFLRVLSDVRQGRDLHTAIQTLNQYCARDHRAGVVPLLLTATNNAAAGYNKRAIAQIPGAAFTYQAMAQGKFSLSADKLPAPDLLELKLGARVMALKNDPGKRWVNGSLGTVTSLSAGRAEVKFDDNSSRDEVAPSSWESLKYVWDEASQTISTEVLGTFTQLPLTPAWAVTIHKAQGLTLTDVRVDLERGAFASGQAYVALSRATTLEGLSLSRALRASDIIVESRHEDYLSRFLL